VGVPSWGDRVTKKRLVEEKKKKEEKPQPPECDLPLGVHERSRKRKKDAAKLVMEGRPVLKKVTEPSELGRRDENLALRVPPSRLYQTL